jgi:ABC-type protease/lipase transport system fused ATPase/permease subunit
LLEAIRGLRARGTTTIVISQRRAVLSVADSVLVMKDGQIDRVARLDAAGPASAASLSSGGAR